MSRPPMLLNAATAWITEAALRCPHSLRQEVAQRLATTPAAAGRLLQKLEDLQWLQRSGTARRPHHQPGAMRQVVRQYGLAGLHEDTPWAQDFLPCLALPDHIAQMAQHAFTELLNNAIEHSGGSSVTVSMRQTPQQLQLLVSDNGRGIFDAIGQTYQITDPAQAMLELAKGKLSTCPDGHSGRGLFFTARLADIIDLHANAQAFQQRDWQREQWHRTRPASRQGSAVYVAFSLDTERRLDDVLRRYSLDGQGYGFERTVVPLQLATGPQRALASRAQARRVALRLQRFRRVELDFDGLAEVGHGFADELLRVFQHQHPEVELVPVNMAPRVAAMVGSVQGGDPA
ncbi:MAG: ATP-binding protein [Pseudomonadota bacterium]